MGSGFYSLGRKWEGNNEIGWHGREMRKNYDTFWHCKEMGRKPILVLVGEGNGKEKHIFVGVGRKKEGKIE